MKFVILACIIIAAGFVVAQQQLVTYTIPSADHDKALTYFEDNGCKMQITITTKASCKNCFMYPYTKMRLKNVNLGHDYATANSACTSNTVSDQLVNGYVTDCNPLDDTTGQAPTPRRVIDCQKCASAQYFDSLKWVPHQDAMATMNSLSDQCVFAQLAPYPISDPDFTAAMNTFGVQCKTATNTDSCQSCSTYKYHKLRLYLGNDQAYAVNNGKCTTKDNLQTKADDVVNALKPVCIIDEKNDPNYIKLFACSKCMYAQYFASLPTQTEDHQAALTGMKKLSPYCKKAANKGVYNT